MGVVQMGVVQMGVVQLRVVQMGVVQVQMGVVQLGVVYIICRHNALLRGWVCRPQRFELKSVLDVGFDFSACVSESEF